MSSTGKVFLGVLAGAAVGAALGILFAPDKGSNTRAKLSKTGEDYLEDFKNKFSEIIEGSKESLATVKSSADDMMEKGRTKAQEVKSELKSEFKSAVTPGHNHNHNV